MTKINIEMSNKSKHEVMANYIQLMMFTAQQLNELWDQVDSATHDAMASGYPFDKSFDEIADELMSWHEAQKVELLARKDEE